MKKTDYQDTDDGPRLAEWQEQRLTDWKNEPTILELKRDLEAARPSQQAQMSKIQHWQNLMDCTGTASIPKVRGRSSVQPKLIRRQAEWRYSALSEPFLGSNKLYTLTPKTFEDKAAVRQNELLLNWQWDTKINKVKFIDDLIRSNVDEGTAIIQTGWDRQTVKVKQEVPVYAYYMMEQEEQFQQFQQAMELRDSNPRAFNEAVPPEVQAAIDYYDETGQATVAIQSGTQVVEIEKVLRNQPTATVLNPNNVSIDPSCNGDFSKALFVILSFETNRADLLKQRGRYKNLDKVIWDNNAPATVPDHYTATPDTFQFADRLRKRVVAYEYWGFYDVDGNGTLKPFVATWIGDVIIRLELNPFPDEKLPFIVIPYSPRKRELFGTPDAELLEDNQKILGAVMRGIIDVMGKSANGQQGMAKGMLDPLNKRRFENGQDYEYNPTNHPTQGLVTHTYPELGSTPLTMLTLQQQEAEALTGVKGYGEGINAGSLGDVAAGIRGALDAASKREMSILRRLAKGINEMGQKFIAMNAVFLSEEEVVRVTNDEFVAIRREDIKGEFDIEVDISTAEVDNAKAQDLAFMLQTIGPNSDPKIAMMILADIARLKRMPDLAERLETFQPEPTPEEQEMQRLAIEKAQLENEVLKSEVKLNEAKAQAELMKATQADVKVQNDVTGVDHERRMAEHQAQSQGNKEYAVTQSLLKPQKQGETRPDVETAIGYNAITSGQVPGVSPTISPADDRLTRLALQESTPIL